MNDGSLTRARIALTCSGLEHVLRGVETWSQAAFEALQALGLEVTLFKGSGVNGAPQVRVVRCLRRESAAARALPRLLPRGGWRIGFGSAYQAEQTTFALSALPRVARRFDLVHTKDPQVAWLFHLAHKLGINQARVILNHGTEEPPEFLKQFDYVQHLAPARLEEAERRGVRGRRQFAVPNFVDTEVFAQGPRGDLRRRLGIPEEAFVVLSVAAVKRHHKRLDWFLSELAPLVRGAARPPIYALVAGSRTRETPSLLCEGAELLGDRIRFLVDYPREAMPEVYRAADLFVLCSLKEMLANACLEALASALPCLMHEEPGARWAIGDGGETLDMTRPGALTEAIRRYQDPARRAEAGGLARAQALARFSKDVVLAQQVAMYRAVLEDQGR